MSDTMQVFSKEELQQQTAEFNVLLQRLGNASSVEIESVLAKRETIEPEPELSPEVVKRIQKRIAQKSSTN